MSLACWPSAREPPWLIHRLGRLPLCAHIVVTAVLLRRSPMNCRGLLEMLGGLLLHFLSTPDTPDGSTSR
jgi:hypothetical protein